MRSHPLAATPFGWVDLSGCMQVNGGFEAEADVGPMITPEAKARCEQLIQAGIDQVGPLDGIYVGCVGRYHDVCVAKYQGVCGVPSGGATQQQGGLSSARSGVPTCGVPKLGGVTQQQGELAAAVCIARQADAMQACQGFRDHSLPRG